MVNILLAFDEQDATMGMFNQGCLEYYQDYFKAGTIAPRFIKSLQLNPANIELQTTAVSPFLFAAYSHGSVKGELHSTQGIYLSTEVNQTNFKNSFVYTVSCHVGNELGTCLMRNGCLCFLGYKSAFNFWDGYKHFSDCANYGFFLFIEKNSTKSIYDQMVEKYNEQIDAMYHQNSLVASLLLENRNALIHLGEDITIDDFTSE